MTNAQQTTDLHVEPEPSQFRRPTRGEEIGTWNVFHMDGRTERDVPWADLPVAVQMMITDYYARNA